MVAFSGRGQLASDLLMRFGKQWNMPILNIRAVPKTKKIQA